MLRAPVPRCLARLSTYQQLPPASFTTRHLLQVRIGRPHTKDELAAMVAKWPKVKARSGPAGAAGVQHRWQHTQPSATCPRSPAPLPPCQAVGVGGSWWPELFCAGTDASAINVVMTELAATRNL